jgi:hypothetical protein
LRTPKLSTIKGSSAPEEEDSGYYAYHQVQHLKKVLISANILNLCVLRGFRNNHQYLDAFATTWLPLDGFS